MGISEFSGYQIGGRMMNAMQLAQDVTGHNIANASNPAYSQQAAKLKAAQPIVDIGAVGEVGGGADVVAIERQRDTYVDAQRVATHGSLGRSSSLVQGLSQLQNVANDADGHGISKTLDGLNNAFAALSAKPDDLSVRQGVIDAASGLTTRIQERNGDLTGLQREADRQITESLAQVNAIADSVSKLNAQIANALCEKQEPNDLMDQRQAELEKLGNLTGAQISPMGNGMVNVSVEGHWLVDQDHSAHVTVAQDPSNPGLSVFTWTDNGQAFTPTSGRIQAAVELRDGDIAGAKKNLDNLALALASDYNGLQASGYALNAPTPGGTAFFKATSASDIQVDPALAGNPAALCAAQTASSPGDGNQAMAFAALATQASPDLGETYTGALATWTSELGASTALSQQQQDTEQASMDQLDKLTAATSGVDLNEQAIRLSQYQHAYEAGARYVETLDKMMQSLLNEIAT